MRKKQFKPAFTETVVQDRVTIDKDTLEKRPAQTLIACSVSSSPFC